MSLVWKILIGIGILVGISLAIGLAVTAFVFGELRQHGVPFGSYSSEHEYEYSETATQTINASGKELLLIKSAVGEIVIEGWDSSMIELEVTKMADEQEVFDQMKIDILTPDDKTVSIIANREKEMHNLEQRLDLVIKVPRHLEITLDHGVGDVSISELKSAGMLDIEFGVGQFKMVNVEAAERIDIDMGVGDGFVKNLNTPSFRFQLGVGEMNVNLPAGAPYMMGVEVGVGELNLVGFDLMLGSKIDQHGFLARSAKVKFGDGSREVHLEVGMGELSIELFE